MTSYGTRQNPTFRLNSDGRVTRLPRFFEALPFGALLLDDTGRILQHTPPDGPRSRARRHDLIGTDFFGELFAGTELEAWGDVFREGIGRGQLHRYANVRVPGVYGPREIVFFFYYHERNAEAWVFIEPVPCSPDAESMNSIAA